ncbi:hypothetical protein [Streptomyces sp. NBC_01361]|uniref:hypothetical protein n=1 Tax=Streptomyces sp. NBC_01361 TaxID=2903838 RepID=UPI002E32A949|nr:hypothetical protein [Streptomyces sp. NBC_01361]
MPFRPVAEIVLRTVGLAAIVFATACILDRHQGLPLALLIFLILLVLLDFVLRRTTYGRHEPVRRPGLGPVRGSALPAAVVVDALSRTSQKAAGRA